MSKTFSILIEEILTNSVDVQAETYEEALAKVEEMYDNEEIVLDSSNFAEVNFSDGTGEIQ